MGFFSYNQFLRLDTVDNILIYPQKALVTSKTI